MTIVVPETRIARSAKESGGGFEGRCRESLPAHGRDRGPACAARWG
ncbi:hypothetical protein [Nocardioides convexus]